MLEISPIPAFNDNYIWLLRQSGGDRAAVVDPGDSAPVMRRLQRDGLTLEAILVTHKHGDHVGGVRELKRNWPKALVFGPAGELIPNIDRPLSEGDLVKLEGVGVELRVMDVPGHTEGHIAYLGDQILFCGDTLFAAGCGRVFSGTHEQLHDSLQRIAALAPATQLYCAHEYTQDNLGFAAWVEPDSEAVARRIKETDRMRAQGVPTVPSILELELRTNPFLRSSEPNVIAAAERYAGNKLSSSSAVFTAIRTWKDREYD